MDEKLRLLEDLKKTREGLIREMHRVIIGQDEIIEKIMAGLFAGGHCLLIGVPGLAKTLMVRTLAKILDLSFKRIQFTPDLMPSDITGTELIQEDPVSRVRNFRFRPGPVFANLVLADEINRATPKTQAALLEAMQEYQVTAAGNAYRLPLPFLVLATQNPIELEGTYPLPEAQLDRFMFSVHLDYPAAEEEKRIAEQTVSELNPEVKNLLECGRILEFQSLVREIPVSDYVLGYAVKLTRQSRPNNGEAPEFIRNFVSWGAGPRAAQYLVLGAKAAAALRGDVNVSVADIRSVAMNVLRHRIFTNFNADAEGLDSSWIVTRLLEAFPD